MITEERIRNLLQRYADNQASGIEITEMLEGLREQEGAVALEAVLKDIFDSNQQDPMSIPTNWEQIWGNIDVKAKPLVKRMNWMSIAAAAVILIMFSLAGYFYFDGKKERLATKSQLPAELKNDAAPGGNRAVLTLADGSQIILDSGQTSGTLTQQGNTNIIKLNDGELVYSPINEQPGEVMFNTISTPKGGQYQVILPDGSKVRLNAASSLKFPTSFAALERKVELNGEAYFEVEENVNKPFIVTSMANGNTRGVQIKVLGTQFNVNAYADEVHTTVSLLEGSVQVALQPGDLSATAPRDPGIKILKPGQQASVGNTTAISVKDQVDMDVVLAWKNGYFSFSNADLQSVMRQLVRWYDVDVVYEGAVPRRQFEGKMERTLNLSEVLKIIETNNIHFKINGKTIIVTP